MIKELLKIIGMVAAALCLFSVSVGFLVNAQYNWLTGEVARKKLLDATVNIRAIVTKNVRMGNIMLPITSPITGTGFYLKHDNRVYLVTNAHICENANSVGITIRYGNKVPLNLGRGSVVAKDYNNDLCLVQAWDSIDKAKTYGIDIEPLTLAPGNPVRWGKKVFSKTHVGLKIAQFKQGEMLNEVVKIMVYTSFPNPAVIKIRHLHMHIDGGNSGAAVVDRNGDVVCVVNVRARIKRLGGCIDKKYLDKFVRNQL